MPETRWDFFSFSFRKRVCQTLP